jgi:RNA ligase (TIGR02306 family)
MERKLASVQIIRGIEPIPDAEFIETAIVNNWKIVINKSNGYKVGDKIIYCEIDSFLPIKEEFEFLRKSSYKKVLDKEGFRLKTIKLRGQVSQGLILPLNILEGEFNEGDDVTELLGITKYEPPIDPSIAGITKGLFPSFIQKTDEERIQNLTQKFDLFKNRKFYATEKLDGTSTTYYVKDGVFGACSRNLELKTPEDDENLSTQWKIAKEHQLKEKMLSENKNFAIQGELIGYGIQKNNYKLSTQKFYVFNVFDIDNYKKLGLEEIKSYTKAFGLNMVPIIAEFDGLPSIDELIKLADGKSVLNNNSRREGLVFRSNENDISFKVISNEYLLKNDD